MIEQLVRGISLIGCKLLSHFNLSLRIDFTCWTILYLCVYVHACVSDYKRTYKCLIAREYESLSLKRDGKLGCEEI